MDRITIAGHLGYNFMKVIKEHTGMSSHAMDELYYGHWGSNDEKDLFRMMRVNYWWVAAQVIQGCWLCGLPVEIGWIIFEAINQSNVSNYCMIFDLTLTDGIPKIPSLFGMQYGPEPENTRTDSIIISNAKRFHDQSHNMNLLEISEMLSNGYLPHREIGYIKDIKIYRIDVCAQKDRTYDPKLLWYAPCEMEISKEDMIRYKGEIPRITRREIECRSNIVKSLIRNYR